MAITASEIIRFSRQMTRLYSAAFAPITQTSPLTMRELHILLFLANNPQFDSAKDIVQYRGLLKSQVSQGVEVLCQQGILRRLPDSADRRCVHLVITDLGQPIATQAQQLQSQWWSALNAELTPQEQVQTQHLIQKWLETAQTLEESLL